MMPILAIVLRVIVILFVVRLVLRFFAGLVRPAPRRPAVRKKRGGDMVRDRVCNTFVPRDRAIPGVIAGQEEYFCSPECRDRAREVLARRA